MTYLAVRWDVRQRGTTQSPKMLSPMNRGDWPDVIGLIQAEGCSKPRSYCIPQYEIPRSPVIRLRLLSDDIGKAIRQIQII